MCFEILPCIYGSSIEQSGVMRNSGVIRSGGVMRSGGSKDMNCKLHTHLISRHWGIHEWELRSRYCGYTAKPHPFS